MKFDVLKFQKSFTAFTLAEVLITLGIIGVVAALTLPSLVSRYKEKATVTQVKKINSLLSQAFVQIRNEEGGGLLSNYTFNNSDVELMNRFGKYLKYQKVCPSNNGGCWKNDMYKSVTGTDYSRFDSVSSSGVSQRSSAILADGSLIMFNLRITPEGVSEDGIFAQIYVDVNGHKPPNQLGVDFFYWFLIGDRIFPGGIPSCGGNLCSPNSFVKNCLEANGHACTGWVVLNENMDYLHCKDLSWNGKSKCD